MAPSKPIAWRAHAPLMLATASLAIHAILALEAACRDCVTADEFAHIPAGIVHCTEGAFLPYRVNPPLPRSLASAPLVLLGYRCPLGELADVTSRVDWLLGEAFMDRYPSEYMRLVRVARLSSVAASLACGVLLYFWARSVGGDWGGLAATVAWCFSPNVLAHAHLVTPDIWACLGAVAVAFALQTYLSDPRWQHAFLVGMVLGLGVLLKFSLLLLLLSSGFVTTVWLVSRESASGVPITTILQQGAAALLVSLLVVNTGYGWDGVGTRLGDYRFNSNALAGVRGGLPHTLPARGNRFVGTVLARVPVPLPEQMVLGLDWQKSDFERGHWSYLHGEVRRDGWWYSYFYVIAVKATESDLALVFLALLVGVARWRSYSLTETALLYTFPALLFIVACSETRLGHNGRYLLPILPYLYASIARLPEWASGQSQARGADWRYLKLGLLVVLLSLQVLGALATRPHFLTYFNQCSGGTKNGPSHLADSNLDWGQGGTYLVDWLAEHPEATPMRAAYWGIADPRVFGLDLPPVPGAPTTHGRGTPAEIGPLPGWHAVSVNYICGLPSIRRAADSKAAYYAPGELQYFKMYTPVARVANSIYVYHLSLEDANRARRALQLPELDPAKHDGNEARR